MAECIDRDLAFRIAAKASKLFQRDSIRGREGCASCIRDLGSVQIDTISVVQRAHHHILWTRMGDYRTSLIPTLEATPRRIFEYWSHAAAYLPMDDYRFCLPRMARVKVEGHDWFRAEPKAIEYVRDRIKAEGPLLAQDFKEPMKGPRGWRGWKPAKVALEYLFHVGELAAVTRRGFQKVYDISERALPADLDRRYPSPEEHAAHHVDRALVSLGIFASRDVAYMRKDGIADIDDEIAARVEDGRLVKLQIEGLARTVFYSSADAVQAATVESSCARTSFAILSPFDPLIIDRRRAAKLLDLEYQLECYLPEAKRQFGYFALPILGSMTDGSFRFVGFVDARVDRKAKRLELNRLAIAFSASRGSSAEKHYDRPLTATELSESLAALVDTLRDFALFNGATAFSVARIDIAPARFETRLRKALSRPIPPVEESLQRTS
jgi:uncharacterized protein YcaQ